MDMLFPPGTPARIPIAAITGTNGKTTTPACSPTSTRCRRHRRPDHHRRRLHRRRAHRRRRHDRAHRRPDGAARPLRRPRRARDRPRRPAARRHGLPQPATSAPCSTSAGDHLGLGGIDTLEQLAEVKRIVVEVARDCAVLNADDERCLRMADTPRPSASLRHDEPPPRPRAQAHPRRRPGVVLEEGINGQMITLYDKGAHIPLLWTHLIPATVEGKAMHNVQNAMFAARDGLRDGREGREHPPRPAHLRHHLLPGPRPPQRLRRAALQGHPRLRPQPRRRARDGRPRASPRAGSRSSASASRASPAAPSAAPSSRRSAASPAPCPPRPPPRPAPTCRPRRSP
jgi:hypothetical protein